MHPGLDPRSSGLSLRVIGSKFIPFILDRMFEADSQKSISRGRTTPNAAESTKFSLPFIAGDSNPTTDNTELQRLRYSGRSRHAEEGSNANSSKADIEVGRFVLHDERQRLRLLTFDLQH